MRELTMGELSEASGGFDFGCDYVGFGTFTDIAGGSGAIGGTLGLMLGGNVAYANVGLFVAIAVASAGVAGYQAGTYISNSIGNCSATNDEGGS